MEYCHQQGVVHHDLKPENILLKFNDSGQISKIKLADFGLHRKTSESLLAGTDSCGTPEYSAPEMYQEGLKFDKKIDSWALGVVLFEMIFDDVPFVSVDPSKHV